MTHPLEVCMSMGRLKEKEARKANSIQRVKSSPGGYSGMEPKREGGLSAAHQMLCKSRGKLLRSGHWIEQLGQPAPSEEWSV